MVNRWRVKVEVSHMMQEMSHMTRMMKEGWEMTMRSHHSTSALKVWYESL